MLAALILVLLGGCTGEEREYVPEAEVYRSWQSTTDNELDYPIPGHENNYRKIFINDRGTEYRRSEESGQWEYRFPEGTKILKEIYEGFDAPRDAEPQRITAMIKAPKHESARGGWLWVVEDGTSGEERLISGEFCITCHSNANESHPYGDGNPQEQYRDYVYFIPSR